jgi:hypothetical protein
MSIANITQEDLLKNTNVRHVQYNGQWYFSVYDLNTEFIGAFKGVQGLGLPLENRKGEMEYINFIPYSQIHEISKKLEGVSDFQQAIDVLFNFKEKK